MIAVADKQTQDPLIGATVSIVSRADTLRGTTVKESSYRISAVYNCDRVFRDSVDLEITYVGYKPFKKRYAPAEFRGYIEAKMEVDEQSIAQVVVVGQQIAMVFKGDTTVYNAGAFKTMADDRLGALLKQMPGIEIKDNKIYSEGKEVTRVLIDGKNLFGSSTGYALTDLEASDVKNVQIYEEQSPEAKRLGDNTAEKEKVMNVETKSKRSTLQGGNLDGTVGASFERDYSGRNEIRHSESGVFYRNSEKGNLRLEASNTKDDGRKENASFNSKITPTKQTDARIEYTYRRGDSTNVSTSVDFGRSRRSSVNRSRTEYFPTDTYALRNEENSSESVSKSLTTAIRNMIGIQRKKRTFSMYTTLSFDSGSSLGRSRTMQQIDDETTRTHLNSDGDNRNIQFNTGINYGISLGKKALLRFNVSGAYSTQNQDGWQIDTLASTPGLRMELRNDGSGLRYNFGSGIDFSYKLGKSSRFSLGYNFTRTYNRSKQLAIDFLGDPRGTLDTVNTYNYTTDTYTHKLRTGYYHMTDDFLLSASVDGSIERIARSERFPEKGRYPRRFFKVNPMLFLSVGKPQRRFLFSMNSFSQTISTEALRSTLNATNPLSLRAGNPDLKMPNSLSGMTGISFSNAKKALNFNIRFNANYTFNYIASRRTLFLEDTYLPQYDYTARKGAQLSTQTNVGGCYNLSGTVGYSQQIAALRSTLNANIGYNFSQTPYFLRETLFHSASHMLNFSFGFDSGFSSKVKINIRSSTSMSSYSTQEETKQDLREQVSGRVDLRFGKYFGSVGTLYEFYCNSLSHTLTRHNVIFNASAGRKFGKKDRLSCSVGIVDILNRPDYATTRFETDYVLTSSTSYLGRYGYLRMAYTF